VQAQIDSDERHGLTSDELGEIKAFKNKVRHLEKENEILKQASIFFTRDFDPRHH
jgi:transposase